MARSTAVSTTLAVAVRGQRARIALWTALTATAAAASLAVPALLAAAVDAALHARAAFASLVLAAVVLAEAALVALSVLVAARFHADAAASLRHRVISDILARGLREPSRAAVGDVLSRLGRDVSGVGHTVSAVVTATVTLAVTVGALVALATIDWLPVVVFLVGALVVAWVMRTFVGRVTEVFVRYRQAQAALSTRLVEALTGARTIRACASVDREIERVLVPARDLSAAGRDGWRLHRKFGWQTQLAFPLLEIAVLATAGVRVASGAITPAALLAVLGYLRLALRVFGQVDTLFSFGESRAGARRVGELLGAPAAARGAGRGRPPHAALEFDGVTVGGPGGGRLEGVDLHVPAGRSLAVVGASGAGKTTLALAAGGLIAPDHGTVRIGGVPLQHLAPADLRRTVAYAFERPELLGDTVDGAIALGAPDSGPSARVMAASAAQAHHFILRLPYGYHTPMDRAPMSGGEAQRLGLARAFAQGELVLILDDATASLDTATEARMATALDRLRRGRTCLVVTHRAATAARADQVAWLDRGRVRAVATHRELWRHPGYRAVFAGSASPAATTRDAG
jgi:ATP-binding cassette, subfamily B, bacterial